MTDWYLMALAFSFGATTGLFAGLGIRLVVDYAELAAYRRAARKRA